MAELEKAGVPTVSFVAAPFVQALEHSGSQFGVKELSRVVVPRPLVGLKDEDIYPYVDAGFDTLVKMLTEPTAQNMAVEDGVRAAEILAVEGESEYIALRSEERRVGKESER